MSDVAARSIDRRWIAACGLDCEQCTIRRFPFDESAADEVIVWYREMGWLTSSEGRDEAIARGMVCTGCQGDRATHWSVDADGSVSCFLLACCVDERGLDHCSDCERFPCDRLVAWSKENESYATAFERLTAMHEAGD